MHKADGESKSNAATSMPADGALKDLGNRLQALSIKIMEVANARDYDNEIILEYMSEDFRGIMVSSYDAAMSSTSRAGFMDQLRMRVTEQPNYRFEAVSACAEVDEDQTKAVVWLTTRSIGFFVDELRAEGISKMDWRRRNGKWVCVKHTGMNGMGGIPQSI